MSPSEVEDLIYRDPFKPLVFIMASGDRVVMRTREGVSIDGLSIVINKGGGRISESVRLVSIPNIAIIDQYESIMPPEMRRRR
jgi:hypothetical protein